MATIAEARIEPPEKAICQGDIFRDVKYSYIESETDDTVSIVEMTFPYAIVISQACDVTFMSSLIQNKSGKATKYMPSILLCPIYDKELFRSTAHIESVADDSFSIAPEKFYTTENRKVAENDLHYRFHVLNVKNENTYILQNMVIDNKHYFTVPISYLMNIRSNRICTLESLFAEQVTLKYATYISRVAIPDS